MRTSLATALLSLSFAACLAAGSADVGPFGLAEFVQPETGSARELWKKLSELKAAIQEEMPRLDICAKHPEDCTFGEAQLQNIVVETEKVDGLAQIEVVNKRVNAAIRYTPDINHWGKEDVWSAPANANKTGSLGTGKGDCEDYALAKYVALRLVGYKAKELLMVLVHDKFVREDHAILTVQYENRWLVLDNRWDTIYDDHDKDLVSRFKPILAINHEGVNSLVKSFSLAGVNREIAPAAAEVGENNRK